MNAIEEKNRDMKNHVYSHRKEQFFSKIRKKFLAIVGLLITETSGRCQFSYSKYAQSLDNSDKTRVLKWKLKKVENRGAHIKIATMPNGR